MLNEEISKCIIPTKAFEHLVYFSLQIICMLKKKSDFLLGRSVFTQNANIMFKKNDFLSSVFPNLLSANKRISQSRCLTSRPSPTTTLTAMAAKLIICGSEHRLMTESWISRSLFLLWERRCSQKPLLLFLGEHDEDKLFITGGWVPFFPSLECPVKNLM